MDSKNIQYRTATKLYDNKDYKGAVHAFTLAIKSEENPEFYYQRGMSYYHLNQLNKTLIDFNKAAELEPLNPFRYSSRAYIKAALKDTLGAIDDYKKAVELDPKDSVAYNNLGLLQEQLGYNKMAQDHFKKADLLAEAESFYEENKKELGIEDREHPKQDTLEKLTIKKYFTIVKSVFSDKAVFNEFLQFVKRGFK